MDDAIDWLLAPDAENPGVRYFALRQLLNRPREDREVQDALQAVMTGGPVPRILAAQDPAGFWSQPGAGYGPKYRGTAWQICFLNELGADGTDTKVAAGCRYLLEHSLAANGGFAYSSGTQTATPSGVVHCLNGNLVRALIGLGWLEDERVQRAITWQARAATGEGGQFTYYRSGTSGPVFACGVNLQQPCAWGAAKALRGLLAIPEGSRSPEVIRALEIGADFLFSRDPAEADYPFTERVSGTWFRLGFPLSYWSDVLEVTEVLVDLGYGRDARLDRAFELILGKRDGSGRWPLENSLNGKTWADIEVKGKPSKWITLRALRTLGKAGRLPG